MPLVNIDVLEGRTPTELGAICDSVHEAMVEHLDVPARDRFQVVTQHTAATLNFDRHYLDIERSDHFVMVRLTRQPAGRRRPRAPSTGAWPSCSPTASGCAART